MPNLADLGSSLAKLIVGRLYGTVWPPRKSRPTLSTDGRTVALKTLGRYIAALTFYRPGPVGGEPITFQIPIERFYPDMPDDVQSMSFPSIVVLPGTAQYKAIGLTPYVEEDSQDRYGRDTAVQWQDEYCEDVQLELWCNQIAERRAILGGIETALSTSEQQSGIWFRMPDYYDDLVHFSINDRRNIDNPNSMRKRRSGTIGLTMRFTIVSLINTVRMRPTAVLEIGPDVDLSRDPNAVVLDP